jgi:hypothetical protein
MRTAIFVYQPTFINISTSESNLELCNMGAGTMPLSAGDNAQTIAPGIYKIVSSQDVLITGDISAYDIITISSKDNDPTPPSRATESFAPLDPAAFQAFLAEADAKHLVNP